MSDFERAAVARIIDLAERAGVEVPDDIRALLDRCDSSHAARTWTERYPDWVPAMPGCCYGDALRGPEACTCWEPIFAVEQAPPRPPSSPADLTVRGSRCGDCAYRRDSPEKADEWSAEHLVHLAATGTPFWCHDGMRRPVLWRHPDGREIEGSTADWQPAMVGPVPFRADGSPGLLCAGWAVEGRRQQRLGWEGER